MLTRRGDLGTDTHTQGERYMKMKAETEVMQQKPQSAHTASKPPGAENESWNRFSFPALRRNQPGLHLDLGLLASTSVGQYISIV